MPFDRSELIGRKFARLKVLSFSGINQEGRRAWLCECNCGSEAIVSTRDLKLERVRSCGCLGIEIRIKGAIKACTTHGKSKSRVYRIWQAMRNRCENSNSPAFKDYGGRGITVCDRWSSFESFFSDMGDPPYGTSIERIDNNKGYSPSNCRWATRIEQGRNRRSSKLLQYGGEKRTQQEWAEMFGISRERISHRLTLGWSVKDALERPVRATRAEY